MLECGRNDMLTMEKGQVMELQCGVCDWVSGFITGPSVPFVSNVIS